MSWAELLIDILPAMNIAAAKFTRRQARLQTPFELDMIIPRRITCSTLDTIDSV